MLKEIVIACILFITISYAYPADPIPQGIPQQIQNEQTAEIEEIFETAEARYGGGGGHHGGGHHGGGHHGGGHHGGGHHGGHHGGGHHGGGHRGGHY